MLLISISNFIYFRAFNVPSNVLLTSSAEPVDIHSLTRSICTTVEAHEILRVTLKEVTINDKVEIIQQVQPISHFRNSLYSVVDLTGHDPVEQEKILKEKLRQFALKHLPFDKQLFNFTFFILSPSSLLLAINVHHIIYDGASMVVLLRELLDNSTRSSSKTRVTLQHQLSFEQAPATVEHVQQWREVLHGVKHSLRFSDVETSFSPESQHIYCPLKLAVQKSLQKVSKTLGVPQTAVINTAVCLALGVMAGQDDFVMGQLGMNRAEGQRGFIGYFAKTLPLRVNYSSKPHLSALVKSILKNSAMVFDSPVQLPDLVQTVPCLKHKLGGEFSPLHVLLSTYHFDSPRPSCVTIAGVKVDVKPSHAFQAHFQSDLFVEIHPRGTLNPTTTIHYLYRQACLNADLIHMINDAISDFILNAQDKLDKPVSVDLFPRLLSLCHWRNTLLPNLPNLSLPTNIATNTTKCLSSFEDKLHIQDPQIYDMLPIMAMAYVLCCYSNQTSIGILIVQQGSVVGLHVEKPAGRLDIALETFKQSFEESSCFKLNFKEFNCVFDSLLVCKGRSYLIWYRDNTGDSDGISCGLGMSVQFTPSKTGTHLAISARGGWFDQQLLSVLAKSFECFLSNAVKHTGTRTVIEDIPYWPKQPPAPDSIKLPSSNIALDRCYIEQLEERASHVFPKATALSQGGIYMTYGFMMQQIVAIATHVVDRSTRLSSNVGIYLTRTPWLYISLLAVLKAGCSYVPISLENPPERILMILKLTDISMVLTESSLLEKLHGYEGKVLCIDALPLSTSNASSLATPPVPLDSLCCILYTSGTTGVPKGVMISNKNLLHAVNNILDLSTPDDSDFTLAACNAVFDAHIIDSLAPLLRGSCLVVADNVSSISAGVTHAFATPSAACSINIPASMRVLVVGGEAFTTACHKKTKHIGKVVNVYGPTECTVFVTCTESFSASDPSNIGQPIPGCAPLIESPSGNPVPPGFPGILHILGDQVTRGYYRDEERTRASFTFSDPPNQLPRYCTGDWVRLLPNGTLQFLGRLDHQVKLRGQRFELLEVENAIYGHGSVNHACTFVLDHGMPSALLVSCVTPENVSIKSLLEHLKKTLPLFMVPRLIVPLKELPLNRVGKTDRAKLLCITKERLLSKKRADDDQGFAESDSLARKIAGVFAQVLEAPLETYSVCDDFFTKGGHSLLVVPLVALVNQKLGLNINASHILQYSTPTELADNILSTGHQKASQREVGFSQASRDVSSNTIKENGVSSSNCSPESVHSVHSIASLNGQDKSEFFFNISGNCDRVSVFNACSKRIATTPSITAQCSIFEDKWFKGEVSKNGQVSLSFAEERFQQEGSTYFQLELLLPASTRPVSPQSQYCTNVLPLHFLQSVTHPESLIEFGFMDPVTPISFPSQFKEEIELGYFKNASDNLLKETGTLVTPESLEEYCRAFKQPLSTLLKHIKAKSFLLFQPVDPVVILHKRVSSENPLFFIHGGIIGWPLPYFLLARQYGLYSVGIQRTTSMPNTSFRQMALYFVEAVLSVQSTGPFSLFGVCYGACLAYEIAHLLATKGHRIKLLVMINNSPVHEHRPALFGLHGDPLPRTSLDPIEFYSKTLDVSFPIENLIPFSPNHPRLHWVIQNLISAYPWMILSQEDLLNLYLPFYNGMKCQWEHVPCPTDGVDTCLLIRNKTHPFFSSEDYGMRQLVKNVVVVQSDRPMGYLSEPATANFVLTKMKQHM